MQRETALALHVSKRTQYLATDDAGQPFGLLRLAAGALNEPTKQHHRGKIGLGHKTLTQLFHHHRQVDDVAAKTAVFLGEGNREPAQLGEKLPVIPAHTLIRGNNGLAGVPVVVVLNKARDRVADHLLFFGKIKIHC